MVTADKLEPELQRWFVEAMREAARVQRNTLTELAHGLIDATPAANPSYPGSGHGKRNWQVSLSRSAPVTEIPGGDPAGVIAKTAADAVIAQIQQKPAESVTVSNPIDYIDELARSGSSRASAGWADRVVAGVAAKYARVR